MIVASTFTGLRNELESHMMKEEHVLFPFIEQLESGLGHRHPMLGHISSPIAMMMQEHDTAGAALTAARLLPEVFQFPCIHHHCWLPSTAGRAPRRAAFSASAPMATARPNAGRLRAVVA